MLQQVAGAQGELAANFEALRQASDPGLFAQAESQLRNLSSLQVRLQHAGPLALASIRAEVSASVAATLLFVVQAQGTVSAQGIGMTLQLASQTARTDVIDLATDIFDRKKYDSYLRFASDDDEKAYRQREAERAEYIKEQLAKNSVQGNLNATAAMVSQMDDAEAHGAGSSAEFRERKAKLTDEFSTLQSDAQAAGVDTSEAVQRSKQVAGASTTVKATVVPEDVKPSLAASQDAISALRAAGISAPQSDDVGHGVAVASTSVGGPIRSA